MTWLEVAANLMASLSILLAARNSVHTWWTGIVGCSLFALLFWRTQLYADVLLQVFFVTASIVGWWSWRGGGTQMALPIRHTSRRNFAWMGVGAVLAPAAMARCCTASPMPMRRSLTRRC